MRTRTGAGWPPVRSLSQPRRSHLTSRSGSRCSRLGREWRRPGTRWAWGALRARAVGPAGTARSQSPRSGVAGGVTAQWTAKGDGTVDWKAYFALFAKLCPEAPVHIETISGAARKMAVNDKSFWKAWP